MNEVNHGISIQKVGQAYSLGPSNIDRSVYNQHIPRVSDHIRAQRALSARMDGDDRDTFYTEPGQTTTILTGNNGSAPVNLDRGIKKKESNPIHAMRAERYDMRAGILRNSLVKNYDGSIFTKSN